MHTKKQSTKTNRKIRKNAINKRTVLSICAAVFLVVIVVLYFVFRGPSGGNNKWFFEKSRETR